MASSKPPCMQAYYPLLPSEGVILVFFIVLANTGPEDFTDAELGAQRDRMQNDKKNYLDTGVRKAGAPERIKLCW
jgi:hypothetical protein